MFYNFRAVSRAIEATLPSSRTLSDDEAADLPKLPKGARYDLNESSHVRTLVVTRPVTLTNSWDQLNR